MNTSKVNSTQPSGSNALKTMNEPVIKWSSYTVTREDCEAFLKQRIKNFFCGTAFGIAQYATVSAVFVIAERYSGKTLERNHSGGLIKIPRSTAVLAGVVEELVFRGVAQNGLYAFNLHILRMSHNRAFLGALVPVSLVFGLLHLTNPKPSLPQVTFGIGMGLANGTLSHKMGLDAAIYSHATVNFIGASVLRLLYKTR